MKGLLIKYYFKNFKGQNSTAFKRVCLGKNYYKILEIQNNASEVIIRKSYLRLAKKLHPDVNPTGHDHFTEVQ
jgi:preprotein translocase subunit Sec63